MVKFSEKKAMLEKFRANVLKSREPEIKSAGTFAFSSKFSSVTYLDFLHARNIHDGTSNIKVSGKII